MLFRGVIFYLYFLLINSIYAGSFISTSNNTSELSFTLEESINLINWHTNQLIEVNLSATNNIKFFRFRSL